MGLSKEEKSLTAEEIENELQRFLPRHEREEMDRFLTSLAEIDYRFNEAYQQKEDFRKTDVVLKEKMDSLSAGESVLFGDKEEIKITYKESKTTSYFDVEKFVTNEKGSEYTKEWALYTPDENAKKSYQECFYTSFAEALEAQYFYSHRRKEFLAENQDISEKSAAAINTVMQMNNISELDYKNTKWVKTSIVNSDTIQQENPDLYQKYVSTKTEEAKYAFSVDREYMKTYNVPHRSEFDYLVQQGGGFTR